MVRICKLQNVDNNMLLLICMQTKGDKELQAQLKVRKKKNYFMVCFFFTKGATIAKTKSWL